MFRYPLPLLRPRRNCPLLLKRESLQRGGGVKSWRGEDVRVGQRVQPRLHDRGVASGATRNVRGASGRAWSRGIEGTEGNLPTSSVSPRRADFGSINGSSSSCNSDDSCTSSSDSNNSSNDSGDLPALVEKPARDLEVFGELPALQSGRMRSQLRGLAMSTSFADALLAYVMRSMEAKKTMEEKATEINELTIHCWKSAWRGNVSDSRNSRGLVHY